jgi:branched-chain amino acid transport system permease protein
MTVVTETTSRGPWHAVVAWATSPGGVTVASIAGLLVAQQVLWPAPAGILVRGVIIGGLTALLSFGIALVYRANRIVNFAQGDLGLVPAIGAVLLIVSVGVPYLVALGLGLALAVGLGALVQFAIIRRFATAPRLILTVATLGLAQLLVALGLALPALAHNAFPGVFDDPSPPTTYPAPVPFSFEIAPIIFNAGQVIAVAAVVACSVALAAFFRFTNLGTAVRASAENADRALLLGIPVRRIQLVVWTIASVLAFAAVFLRAGAFGLSLGSVLGPALLVRSLAACVMGRMTNLPLILASAVTLGVVEQAIVWDTEGSALVAPILFLIVLAVLLLQRRDKFTRVESLSSWKVVTDVRPIPPELGRLPEVRWVIRGLAAALAATVVALPLVLSASRVNLAGVIVIFAMVGVSLVVLTGWSGQVSLGQVGFVAIGAIVGAWVTSVQGWDLAVALLVAGLVGAAASAVIGLPALRIRGLLLAITTLAFAQAVATFGLNRTQLAWLPRGHIDRPPLLGLVPIESEAQYYYFTVACLLGVLAVTRRVRRSRVGRVMIAVRENDQGAQAYGVNPVRAKLTAFALSGFIASLAGAVFVHHQQGLGIQPYGTEQSLVVFTMVVIGGLGSLPGAVLGALYVKGVQYFLPAELSFFAGGVGLLLVLLTLPEGLGSLFYKGRDAYLRQVALRRKIMVPSLFADADDLARVGLSRERGLAFLREMADRLDSGGAGLLPGMAPGVDPTAAALDAAAQPAPPEPAPGADPAPPEPAPGAEPAPEPAPEPATGPGATPGSGDPPPGHHAAPREGTGETAGADAPRATEARQ